MVEVHVHKKILNRSIELLTKKNNKAKTIDGWATYMYNSMGSRFEPT